MRSRLVPVLDVLFIIYLLILFVSIKYRRKPGAGERRLKLHRMSNDGG